MNDYNTDRPHLILKEYGRNVQKLVDFMKNEKDKAKRSEYAQTIVELMKQVTPTRKDVQENAQKLWDDLFIISNFELDIDSPYPIPDKSIINRKPNRVAYQSNRIKYLHYGRNIELLIKEAVKKEDPAERENAVIYIGKLMKSFYSSWNKEVIDDAVILDNIKTISDGELTIDIDRVKEDNLFEKLYKTTKKKPRPPQQRQAPRRNGGTFNKRRRSN